MEVTAGRIVMKNVKADSVEVAGQLEAGTVIAESLCADRVTVKESASVNNLTVFGLASIHNLDVSGAASGNFPVDGGADD